MLLENTLNDFHHTHAFSPFQILVCTHIAGSVGEYIEKGASQNERKHFFEFIHLISDFERKVGLQQNRDYVVPGMQMDADGGVTVQLGSKLKVQMKFVI